MKKFPILLLLSACGTMNGNGQSANGRQQSAVQPVPVTAPQGGVTPSTAGPGAGIQPSPSAMGIAPAVGGAQSTPGGQPGAVPNAQAATMPQAQGTPVLAAGTPANTGVALAGGTYPSPGPTASPGTQPSATGSAQPTTSQVAGQGSASVSSPPVAAGTAPGSPSTASVPNGTAPASAAGTVASTGTAATGAPATAPGTPTTPAGAKTGGPAWTYEGATVRGKVVKIDPKCRTLEIKDGGTTTELAVTGDTTVIKDGKPLKDFAEIRKGQDATVYFLTDHSAGKLVIGAE